MNFFPPTVDAKLSVVEIGQSIALKDMFEAADLDGNPITYYRVRDNGNENFSGYFTINGVRQDANVWVGFGPGSLPHVRYQASLIEHAESFSVQVWDGKFWSNVDASQVYTVPSNNFAPVVTATNGGILQGEVLRIDDLFTVTDRENNPITRYYIVDRLANQNGGYFFIDGKRLPSAQWFLLEADEIDTLAYIGGAFGPQSEKIGVMAYDGKFWSNTAEFTVATFQNKFRPTINVFDLNTPTGRVIDLQSMFNFNDADGNTLKLLGIYDTGIGGNSGNFTFNGVVQAAQEWFYVTPDQIPNIKYNVSQFANEEIYRMIAYDGQHWSTVVSGTATAIPRPTIDVLDYDVNIDQVEEISFSDLVVKGDAGVPFTQYQVIDQNTAFDSSRLVLNGQLMGQGNVITLTPNQFNDLVIRGSTASDKRTNDQFLVRARNPLFWSEWEEFRVNTDPVGNKALRTVPSPSFWTDTDNPDKVIIPYTFAQGYDQNDDPPPPRPPLPYYYADDSDEANDPYPLNDVQQNAIRLALNMIETYIDVDFVEVPFDLNVSLATIMFCTNAQSGSAAYEYGLAPRGGGDAEQGIGNIQGDIWYNNTEPTPGFDPRAIWTPEEVGPGSFFYTTTIHEVGHALGLKHPFSDPGQTLPLSVDLTTWTVMSYTTPGPGQPEFHPDAGSSTYNLWDVEELQLRYNANEDFNPGNTHYFYSTTESRQQTLWDGGGIDTINLTHHSQNETISLREGTFTTLNGVANSLLIAYGAVIENARGGTGNDTIIGNSGRNLLFGNEGNDTIEGDGGNDLIRGGAGNDTYIWRTGDGRDSVREENKGGIDVLEIYDDTALDLLQDDLVFRKFGNDLRVDLAFNQGEGQGTVQIKDMGFGMSRVETLRLFNSAGDQIGEDVDLNSVFVQSDSSPQRFKLTNQQTAFGYIAVPV